MSRNRIKVEELKFAFPLFSIIVAKGSGLLYQVMNVPTCMRIVEGLGKKSAQVVPAYGVKVFGGDGTVLVIPQDEAEDGRFTPRDTEPL